MRAVILLALLLALIAVPASGEEPFKNGSLTIVRGRIHVELKVEVADTPETQSAGLINRTRLDEYAGMFLIFEETKGTFVFWRMAKGFFGSTVRIVIPLSIAFIDEQLRIVDIKDVDVGGSINDPNTWFVNYQPAKPCRYVLEVNQGFFKRHRLGVGAKITYSVSTPRLPYVPHRP